MYNTSHCSGGSCGYSPRNSGGLEYIASAAVSPTSARQSYQVSDSENTFYSASAVMEAPQSAVQFSANFAPLLYESGRIAYGINSLPYELFKPQREYNFQPDNFLKPGKEGTFVGKAEQIREHIETAFEKIFHLPFPNDVKISVLEEKKFRKLAPHPSTQGLSINRSKQGLLSEVFVLQGSLARTMLTLGHELGHVLTETLQNPHDEEAKAYAFSLAWIDVIQKNNIAGLKDAFIIETPAHNGLHNVAFEFVHQMIKSGKRAWDIYLNFTKKLLSVNIV